MTEENPTSAPDGLNVVENDDGTFTLEWDENDPRYAVFNGLSEEQIQAMIQYGLQEIINREEIYD